MAEIVRYDKKDKVPQMHHIDYGLGLFRAGAFAGFPRDAVVDLAAVQTDLCARGQLAGYEMKQRFYEIGSHEGLNELDQFLLRTHSPPDSMSYAIQHLRETAEIVARSIPADCEKCVAELRATRDRGGRLFILGVGGSAANASHAVNDFRKIAGLECYAPTDNVSELTARTNDEGWASVFVEWLRGSRLNAKDCAPHPLRRRRQPGEKRLAQSRDSLSSSRSRSAPASSASSARTAATPPRSPTPA
jgi:hypothetical protein